MCAEGIVGIEVANEIAEVKEQQHALTAKNLSVVYRGVLIRLKS